MRTLVGYDKNDTWVTTLSQETISGRAVHKLEQSYDNTRKSDNIISILRKRGFSCL